jgi:hypothetical protein
MAKFARRSSILFSTDLLNPAIYGKLTIDVGRYYHKRETFQESLEMESGRSIAPIINSVFQIVLKGATTAGLETDQSYIEEAPVRNPLSEWDQTEIEIVPPEEEVQSKKKRKEKKHPPEKSKRNIKERKQQSQKLLLQRASLRNQSQLKMNQNGNQKDGKDQ